MAYTRYFNEGGAVTQFIVLKMCIIICTIWKSPYCKRRKSWEGEYDPPLSPLSLLIKEYDLFFDLVF